MPCDSVRLCQVNFQAARPDILAKALKKMGWRVHSFDKSSLTATTAAGESFRLDFGTGVASVRQGSEHIVDEAKQAYTVGVAQAAAKRFNWDFKMTGKSSFVIKRRY